jgi:TolA-binding protein
VQSAPNVATQIQEMEDRLEKSLLARMPCEKMETDEADTKVQQLEMQIQQLATRQQSLEGIVHEHHNQHTAQVQTLQTQMLSQLEVQRSQMKGMFDEQMSRLEAILAKKGRHE